MNIILNKFIEFFASFRLSCLLFFLLFITTLLGTIEQKYIGIYQAQAKYFSSIWYMADFNLILNIKNFTYLRIPLPGVYLLIGILFINNIVGSIKRIPWRAKKIGVWVTHAGMIILLVGSFITSKYATEGHLTVQEGKSSNKIVSFENWEMAIIDTSNKEHDTEYVFPVSKNTLPTDYVIQKNEIPFTVKINQYYTNAIIKRHAPLFPKTNEVINDYYITPVKTNPISERNFSAAYVTITDNKGLNKKAILWGSPSFTEDNNNADAILIKHQQKTWAILLRKVVRLAPFYIHLDKVTKTVYPGTNRASAFRSFITKIDGNQKSRYEIYMNAPLRDRGYIFFQSGYNKIENIEKAFSTFSVVQNPTDHVPLIACIIISIGMLYHFIFMLIQFMIKKLNTSHSGQISYKISIAPLLITLLALCLPLKSYFKKSSSHWENETVKLFKLQPIQIDGRVKPLETVASFALLKLNGKRSINIENDKKLTSMEWFLTTLFYPNVSKNYKVFLVDDSDFLKSYGLQITKRRNRYSYNELKSITKILTEHSLQIGQINKKNRNRTESAILQLASKIRDFENIAKTLDFVRSFEYKLKAFKQSYNGDHITITSKLNSIMNLIEKNEDFKNLSKESLESYHKDFADISREIFNHSSPSIWFTIFPYSGKRWLSPIDLLMEYDEELKPDKKHFEIYWKMFYQLKAIIQKIENKTETKKDFKELAQQLNSLAYSSPVATKIKNKVKMESDYYNFDLIYNGLILFLLVFISISLNLIKNNLTWNRINYYLAFAPTLLLTLAITQRCIIMSRPPIASLYETILFITLCIAYLSLFIEPIFRNKIALYACSALGTLGLFISYKYELGEATDTMRQLEAVLNSNFWLATHVTAINIGYAAGLLAAGLAHIYLIMKVLRLSSDKILYSTIYKIIYGVVCFSIIFSLIGTVLGGIWANYSWGRFWGWDPKENGALGICLWILIMLHARFAGIFKEFGMIIMTVVLGMVIVASWFGVNLLNTGLHTYGFTEGLKEILYTYWRLELFFIIGCIVHFYTQKSKTIKSKEILQPKD